MEQNRCKAIMNINRFNYLILLRCSDSTAFYFGVNNSIMKWPCVMSMYLSHRVLNKCGSGASSLQPQSYSHLTVLSPSPAETEMICPPAVHLTGAWHTDIGLPVEKHSYFKNSLLLPGVVSFTLCYYIHSMKQNTGE